MSVIRVSRESGTSASAPVFAAMVTLWNSLRLAHGLPPMGFVAPFLYSAAESHPSSFQDVTTGNNVSYQLVLQCEMLITTTTPLCSGRGFC
jgi:hypothetical protein